MTPFIVEWARVKTGVDRNSLSPLQFSLIFLQEKTIQGGKIREKSTVEVLSNRKRTEGAKNLNFL